MISVYKRSTFKKKKKKKKKNIKHHSIYQKLISPISELRTYHRNAKVIIDVFVLVIIKIWGKTLPIYIFVNRNIDHLIV